MPSFHSLFQQLMPESASTLILYLLGFLLLGNTVNGVRRWHRLRHVPGPPLAGWTSLWSTKQLFNGTLFNSVPAMMDKYGE